MAYDRALISAILRDMELERQRKAAEIEDRVALLEQRIPRIAEINRELRRTSARAMRIAFTSNNTDAEIGRLREHNEALQAEKKRLMCAAGYPADYLTMKPNCPRCGDSGYVENTLCSCVKQKAAQKQKQELSSLLPIDKETFTTFRLDYYSDRLDSNLRCSPRDMARLNMQKCISFAENFGKNSDNLILYGSSGLGKTFLSSCIARRVTERGFSVTYDTAISIFDQYNAAKFGGDTERANRALQRYRSADLLIVDDLGTEMSNAFYTACLYDLLNGRLMRKQPTILSTNLLPNQLESRYTGAIASRILGEFTQLRFIGEDIRKIQKRQRMETP